MLLVYSRACTGSLEWARYLHKLFSELCRARSRLAVRHLPVEDLASALPGRLEAEILNSRLQVVVVSPVFLQWVYRNPSLLVGRLLQQDRVIALLLGVREEQGGWAILPGNLFQPTILVLPEHRSSLLSFPQWVHLEARDHDLEFVQTVLYFSTQVLSATYLYRTVTISPQILQRTEARPPPPVAQESLAFTVFPRKVTESQPRAVLMLDRPLAGRAAVRVLVERNSGQRLALQEVKLKSPQTLVVTLPVCLFTKSALVQLYLEVDGESRGFRQLKCESRTHELDSLLQSVCDPLEFLCQTLGQCKVLP